MKKNVLFFITTLGGGGAEKVLTTLIKNLNKDKYNITVVSLFNQGVYIDEIKKYCKYKYCFEPRKPGKSLFEKLSNVIFQNIFIPFLDKYPSIYYKFFIREKFDVEIAFLENRCAKIIGSSKNNNSKKYLWIHTDLKENNWVKYQFKDENDQRFYYNKFDKIFCVSEKVKATFNELFGLNEKTQVLYNVYDDKEIKELSKIDIDIDKSEKIFRFITVGRFVKPKGYDRLLEAHKRLINQGYDYELWFLGDGIEKNNYEKFINDNNLQNYTKIHGFKNNPYKYISKCNAFICSSRVEGYSNVVVESTILGIPVVSTDCSGPNEILENGKNGIIVPNNVEGIIEGMKLFLDFKDKYEYFKKNAEKRGAYFELHKSIEKFEEILDY